MNGKNLNWKIKTAGEIILFTIYLLSGMMMGWTLALGETSLEKTASTLSMSVAFILLWVIHRWRNSMFFNIRTPIDGAITGAVFSAARVATYYFTYFAIERERAIVNIYIDWLIMIVTGFVLGWIYGWLNRRRKAGKFGVERH